jgi:RNA polymerase sigma factor (sigma-70 family)
MKLLSLALTAPPTRESFPMPPLPALSSEAPRPERSTPAPLPNLAQMEERTLCDDALRGDVSAWNALVQKHNHRVVVSLLARGVRIDRAKDIAQDAWIRLIEQQREGRLSHLQLPGLAVAQAGFLAMEAARRAKRTEPIEADAEDVVDPSANAEMRLLTEERLARAERILSRCSPSARSVFRLAYGGEGLSHADIAARLGLSLQRVRQIVCEVRKQLRSAVLGAGHAKSGSEPHHE